MLTEIDLADLKQLAQKNLAFGIHAGGVAVEARTLLDLVERYETSNGQIEDLEARITQLQDSVDDLKAEVEVLEDENAELAREIERGVA